MIRKVFVGIFVLAFMMFGIVNGFATDIKVVVEAEKFIQQENGVGAKIEGRIGSSQNWCFINWNNRGHLVQWEVDIPETHSYKVVFRYANGRTWNSYRDFKIDGKYPSNEFVKISFAPTGGFCKDKNDWQNLTITDVNGKPVLIKLEKGKHLIQMTNLGGDGTDGATNLDCFGFFSEKADPNELGK